MTAVIWTDVVQMSLYVAGRGAQLLGDPGTDRREDGATWRRWREPPTSSRSSISSFAPSMEFFSKTYTFWAGVAGGCFLTTASHGTDQLMVQRLLERQRRTAEPHRAALELGGDLRPVHAVPADRNTALRVLPDRHLPVCAAGIRQALDCRRLRMDSVYINFIWTQMPVGVAGLIIAAILAAAMANISAGAELARIDHRRGLLPADAAPRGVCAGDEKSQFRLARLATIFWGAVLLTIGLLAQHVALGARGWTGDCVRSLRSAAGRVPPGYADQAGGRSGLPWREWWPAWRRCSTCASAPRSRLPGTY